MPVEPPFHTYREQLWPLYQGLALWKPNPGDLYDRVSIGDVGYVSEGAFIRMFNVRLPWDDESNRTFGIPDRYDPLGFGHLNIRRETFGEVDHYSRCVFRDENANNMQAASPEQADGVAYSCPGRGALLSLPHGGCREDAVQMKIFEKYIQDNVVSWFIWAQNNQLGVERMEDLILVSGCTLVTTWAAAVFMDRTIGAEISLASRTLSNGGANFVWSNFRGPIVHHNSRFDPHNSSTTPDQCVFIKGFRAKRVLFRIKPLRAAAEPLPDDPDNRRDGDIHVTPVPGVSKVRGLSIWIDGEWVMTT
ncbi:hypothetical protein F5888DRAFT_924496 [Russula emetica]|nr:hypothetical protein F5888DRAFT_924496 [Russula emetica]